MVRCPFFVEVFEKIHCAPTMLYTLVAWCCILFSNQMMPPDVPEGGKGVVGSTKGGWHGIFGRSVMFHMGCMGCKGCETVEVGLGRNTMRGRIGDAVHIISYQSATKASSI